MTTTAEISFATVQIATYRDSIYLGPHVQVTDDFGNTLRRGEPAYLNIHDWQVLSKSMISDQFLFLSPQTLSH